MINLEKIKLEQQMDVGTEAERSYLNDFLENKKVPPEYLGYCKRWKELHARWLDILKGEK